MTEPSIRIYLVEDEALIQMEIRDRLTRLGYTVCGAAARGETALDEIPSARPDLVLMDINLAGAMNGIETAAELRETGDIPVVFLTAYSDDELLRRAVETGPFGYLVKPFEARELHATIQAAYHRHRADRLLRETNAELEVRVRERTDELAASEARLRHLFSTGPAIIYASRPDGDYGATFISPNVSTVFGYAPEEFIHDSGFWANHIYPDDAPGVFAGLQKLPEHDAHSHEYRFRHKDGTWRWVRDDLVLLRDPDGTPREMVGAWLDITTRKEAERALYESQHVLSTILERTGQGFWFIDNDAVTTDVNPAMCAILGRPREEILGKDIYAFVDEENAAIFRCEIEKRRRGLAEPYEIALSRPDGTLVPCINTPSPFYGQDGKKTGSVGIWTDISARKQFERALADANATLERRVEERTAELADSERFNRGILDSISSHLAVLDGDGRIVAANAAWRRFADANDLDWQKIGEQANYLKVCERTTGECADDAHAVAAGIRDVIAGRRDDFTHEYPCHTPGEQRWFLCRVSRFSSDAPLRLVVAHDNVTAVHRALDDVAASERTFVSLALAAPVGIFRTDAEGNCLYVNPRWQEITGLSEAEAQGYGWTLALHSGDRQRTIEERTAAASARTPFRSEYRFVRADGGIAWVIGQTIEIADAAGGIAGYMGTITDITERKLIELAMRAISTDLISLEGDAYFETAVRWMTEALEADIGFTTQFDSFRPDELRTVAIVEDGAILPNFAYPIAGTPCATVIEGVPSLVSDGVQQKFPLDAYLVEKGMEAYAGEPLVDHNGRTIGHLGIMRRRPISDAETFATILKMFSVAIAAAMTRQRNRRQYEDLFEFAPDALVMTDRQGRIVLANRQAENIFGWSRAEMTGQPVEMLVPTALREPHVGLRDGFLQSPGPRRMATDRLELQAQRKDGSAFPVEIDLAPVETETGVMIAAAVRDITVRKSLEAQLSQAIKMEAIGKLTGGMAHDFNNYLGVIIGNLDLLKETGESDPGRVRFIDSALGAAERGAELTSSLLAFSRRQPLDPRTTDLNRSIEEITVLLRRALGEEIEFQMDLDPDLWRPRIDSAQFDSCIVNLANNARDAMPQGGALTVTTRNTHLDEHYALINPDIGAGDYVLIEVSDTGEGMAPDIAERVFEPFFTTKGPGHGSGLGLSMIYGFVKQSDGHIKIYSEPGHGTTVRIYLPRAAAEPDAVGDDRATTTGPSPQEGTETILVVEDNEDMRKTAVAQLSSLGYRVIEAENGAAAVAVLDQPEPHIDLLFTDVVMPGNLDGYALVARAAELRPGIRVLLTSGFPGDTLSRNGKHAPGLRLLSKPYRKEELAQAIRTAIGDQAGSLAVSGGTVSNGDVELAGKNGKV